MSASAPVPMDVGPTDEPQGTSVEEAPPETVTVAAVWDAPHRESLRARILRGSAVTLAGFGGAQFLRVVSSVILTRLLSRADYGLYRLANVFLEGLAYFTAVGSGPAVIQNERGDDPAFLNTAWTLQSVRGVGLWLAACLLAAPYAWFYRQPILWILIPVVGLTVLLDSFDSVAVHWCNRHMKLGGVTTIEFLRQLTTLIVTIWWAYCIPSVWAFPAGAICGCVIALVLTHSMLPGPRSRFHWEPEAARSLFHFGKWIFASSALEFICRQLDILLLGYCVEIGQLGTYGLAVNLAEPLATLNMRLSRQVLFPTYSLAFRDSVAKLRQVFYRTRWWMELLHLPALGVAMTAGSGIVRFLLDPRFAEAGWIFQILCIRTSMKCLFHPLSVCCIAVDATHSLSVSQVVRMIWVVMAVPLGWHFWGLSGVVWAVALSEVPGLLALYWTLWRAGVVRIIRELLPPAMVAVGCLLGLMLCRFLP